MHGAWLPILRFRGAFITFGVKVLRVISKTIRSVEARPLKVIESAPVTVWVQLIELSLDAFLHFPSAGYKAGQDQGQRVQLLPWICSRHVRTDRVPLPPGVLLFPLSAQGAQPDPMRWGGQIRLCWQLKFQLQYESATCIGTKR